MNVDEDINNEDVELGVVKLHEEGPSDKEDAEEQKLIRSGEKVHHLERMSQYKTYAKVGKTEKIRDSQLLHVNVKIFRSIL